MRKGAHACMRCTMLKHRKSATVTRRSSRSVTAGCGRRPVSRRCSMQKRRYRSASVLKQALAGPKYISRKAPQLPAT